MVQFVTLLQTAQNRNGRLDVGLIDHDLLEPALKRGIFFDVFAVLVQCRRTDAVQLAARQRRFEHVAGIHGTFGLASPDHGVQFIDENDVAAIVLRQLLQHGLQPLLELAAELGAGQQAGEVK